MKKLSNLEALDGFVSLVRVVGAREKGENDGQKLKIARLLKIKHINFLFRYVIPTLVS